MNEVETDVEKDEEKKKAEQEKKDKEAKEKAEKAPAQGKYAGGPVVKGSGEKLSIVETYVGIGPLAVPCTRGEQKAVTGDHIVVEYVDLNGDGVDDEFIYILPADPVQAASSAKSSEKGMTAKEYADFLQEQSDKREEQKAKAESTDHSVSATSKLMQGDVSKRPVGGVTQNPPPAQSRPRTS